LFLDIGVPEDEPRRQFVFLPVHLASDNAEQGFAVDQDFDTLLLDHLIERAWFLDIFEVIGQTRTASVLDSYADHLGVGLVEELFQVR